jgi:hypothetical protein
MTAAQTTEDDFLTLNKLADEVRHLKGQVVLMHDTEMAALIGVGMDADDLYYIAQPLKKDQKPIWYSAVGACCGLKPYLPEDQYARIEGYWRRAGLLADDFHMLAHLEDGEAEPYNPDIHDARRLAISKRRYEEAVARAAKSRE